VVRAAERTKADEGVAMKTRFTDRGFAIIEFDDVYGVSCSLQESSSVSPTCIWFGCNQNGCESANTRMHLSQKQVKLLPHLMHFAETGSIALPKGNRKSKKVSK
jgi:hypothetical protein